MTVATAIVVSGFFVAFIGTGLCKGKVFVAGACMVFCGLAIAIVKM